MNVPEILHPGGFTFRPLNPSDTQAVFAIHADEMTRLYTRLLRQQTPDEIESWLRYYPHYKRHGYGIWAIIHKKSGALVGLCGLRVRKDLDGATDLSYRMHPDWRRQGIARAAVGACISFGFERLNLPEIWSQVHRDNEFSHRIMLEYAFEITAADSEWITYLLTAERFSAAAIAP